jgi:hypothetical protein
MIEIRGFTDASSRRFAGSFTVQGKTREIVASDFSESDAGKHINIKEGLALVRSLGAIARKYSDIIKGSRVECRIDNQTLEKTILREGSSKNRELTEICKQLFWLQINFDFKLEVAFTPSKDNEADEFTREDGINDLRLKREAFLQIWMKEGPFDFDLMASSENVQKDLKGRRLKFFSRYLNEGTEGIDVFKQNLKVIRNGYCFPPFCMVGSFLQLCKEQTFKGVCILPDNGAYWSAILDQNIKRSWILTEPGEKDSFQVLNKSGRMIEKSFNCRMRVCVFGK